MEEDIFVTTVLQLTGHLVFDFDTSRARERLFQRVPEKRTFIQLAVLFQNK